MSLRLTSSEFKQILGTAKAVRETDDWKITVQPNSFRLETCSENRCFYFRHVLFASHFSVFQIDEVSSPFWINIDPKNTGRNTLFQSATSGDVILTLPGEWKDKQIKIRSGNCTFRFATITPDFYFPEFIGDQIATVSLRSDLVNKAVQAANLVGSHMRITVDPDMPRINFAAHGDSDGFSYTPSPQNIEHASGHRAELNISIRFIRRIISRISDSAVISLALAQDYLKIEITGHLSNAKMSLYIAKSQNPY